MHLQSVQNYNFLVKYANLWCHFPVAVVVVVAYARWSKTLTLTLNPNQKIDTLCFLAKLTLEELQEKHFPKFENMCLKLDNGKRDYEALAAKYDEISVDERESLHDERQRKGGSPSRELMSYIKAKYPDHPVVELIKNLKDIGRKDIALILKPLVKNQAWNYDA